MEHNVVQYGILAENRQVCDFVPVVTIKKCFVI